MSERLDSELSLKAIVGFGVGLLIVLAASSVFLWYFSKFLRGYEESLDPAAPALEAARAPYDPPGPQLQSDPEQEMRELLEQEDAVLETYGWEDEANGIARVPVERAITLLVGDDGPAETPAPTAETTEAGH